MSKTIAVERNFDSPIRQVWKALTIPEILEKWFMKTEFKLDVGTEFRFHGKPREGWDGVIKCKFTEIDPPSRLCYTWAGNHVGNITYVKWELTETENGTKLKLEHSGFSEVSISPIDWFQEHVKGWNRYIDGLHDFMEAKK